MDCELVSYQNPLVVTDVWMSLSYLQTTAAVCQLSTASDRPKGSIPRFPEIPGAKRCKTSSSPDPGSTSIIHLLTTWFAQTPSPASSPGWAPLETRPLLDSMPMWLTAAILPARPRLQRLHFIFSSPAYKTPGLCPHVSVPRSFYVKRNFSSRRRG